MHDFEAAIRAVHKAAKNVSADPSPLTAEALSFAVHEHRPTIQQWDRLHTGFEIVRGQLLHHFWEWLEAASEEGPHFEPTLTSAAISAARNIESSSAKFGQFIRGLDG